MSIYSTAGFPVPLISYSILHQAAPGVLDEEYRKTMSEMHARVAAESAALAALDGRAVADLTARQSQMLRGALSDFLQTPVSSDNQEVQKIFQESFEKYRDQLSAGAVPGTTGSWEGALSDPRSPSASVKTLLASGKKYIRSLGFSLVKGSPPLYESVYCVTGARNLDVLEHIVRDRLGIYASTHGKHIGESRSFTVAAHNMILSSGSALPPRGTWGEAALFFSKPFVTYDEFRAALTPFVGTLGTLQGVPAVSLWQRKLGLGKGEEFILRCMLAGPEVLTRIAEAMKSAHSPLIRDALGKEGRLVLKELLPSTLEKSAGTSNG